jgi:hypothetical protein
MEYGVSYFQKALHNYAKSSYKINLTCDNWFIGNFLYRYHDIFPHAISKLNEWNMVYHISRWICLIMQSPLIKLI